MKKAFTLIESLIVAAIIVAIALITLLSLRGASSATDLNDTTQQIIASLRTTQSETTGQTNGAAWGVHFSNVTSTAPFYATFKGTSYASGTVQGEYRLPITLGFVTSTLALGSSEDIIFSPVSGGISGTTIIQLYVLSQPSLTSLIVIEPTGAINTGASYLYIADGGNGRIQKFTTNGTYLSQFPFSADVDSLAVNNNGIYIAIVNTNQIEHLSLTGAFINSFGSMGSGPGQFETPYQIALDSKGDLFAIDYGNDRVEEFDSNGNYLNQFGSAGTANGQFENPSNMAIDASNNIYVTDNDNNRVEKFNSSFVYQSQFGICSSGSCAATTTAGSVNGPSGVTVDANGNVFISDTNNNRVEKFSSNGNYLTQFGSAGTGNGQFNYPGNLAVDANGNVYVADLSQNRVEQFDNSGNYLSQFGCTSGVCADGSGNGQFTSPQGMTVAAY